MLISLAISVAFVASAASWLGFFELEFWWELSALVVVMLLGHWQEMKALGQARGAVSALAALLPDDAEVLITLRARGYRLLVISPDPIPFERQRLAESEAVAVAARLANLERQLLLARLRQADIRVVDWPVETPFEYAAHAALSRMQYR